MNRRIAVRGIFVIEGKLLCAKLKPYNKERTEDFWCTPGGGVDDNEALIPALEREIIEELGIKPLIGNLVFVQQFIGGGEDNIEFFFHVLNPHDYLSIDLTKTSHGEAEIESIDFINPGGHNVLPKFLTTEDFSDLENQPVKVFSYL